jgi:glyoxylase-like metal-dependent hydrolase (beta-lactamase superfamily II)
MQASPAVEVAENIYQVQIPLPFLLNIVNCYLLRDDAGWTILDTGLHRPEGEAAWRAAFSALDIRPRDIKRIFVTHHHPDHYGMAGWLRASCAEDGGTPPPVFMSTREAESVREVWERRETGYPALTAQLARCGVPADLNAAIIDGVESTRLMTLPHPPRIDAFTELTPHVWMGGRRWQVILAAGHSDAQTLFYAPEDKLLLSADHVLMKITPNIGQWAHTDPQPLRRFLASLADLRDLDVRLALPGHKTLITDWRGRIDELLAHHAQRLERMRAAVGAGAATVYDAARAVFPFERLTLHEHRFAIAETLAHLDTLIDQGVLRREMDTAGVWHHTPSLG